MSAFNEDSRVKIPAILHLTRLGYTYLPLKTAKWEEATNIFPEVFRTSLSRINPDTSPDEITSAIQEMTLLLDYEDLGKAFHERLLRSDGIRLIDFDDFNNNTFNVVTELPCKNGDDEFRPDVTLLINGMPLFFMEVKKPNPPPTSANSSKPSPPSRPRPTPASPKMPSSSPIPPTPKK